MVLQKNDKILLLVVAVLVVLYLLCKYTHENNTSEHLQLDGADAVYVNNTSKYLQLGDFDFNFNSRPMYLHPYPKETEYNYLKPEYQNNITY